MESSSGTTREANDPAGRPPPSPTAESGALVPVPVPVPAVRLRFSAYSIVRAALVVVLALLVLTLVSAAATPLWWLAIASVVAAFFQPAALYLRRFMPGWLAILIVVIVVLAIGGFLSYRGVAEMRGQFEALSDGVIKAARDISASKQFGQVATEFGLVDKVTKFFDSNPLRGGDTASTVQTAASSGGALFAIAMLSLLMLIFGRRLVKSSVSLIEDPQVERRVLRLVVRAYAMSSKYVWLMVLRAAAIGAAAAAGSAFIGLDAPTAIGLWFAALSLLPALGIVIASLPLVAFEAIVSVPTAAALVVIVIWVQLLDVIFVQRRIETMSVRVGPGLTLIGALIGLQLYGLGGLLVMLALVVFGVSAGRVLTRGQSDVFTAVRGLVAQASN